MNILLYLYNAGYYGGYSGMYSYLIFVLPAFILSLFAQAAVKKAYRKYSTVRLSSGLTGSGAAARVLHYYGITNVSLGQISGNLTDNFNPRTNIISLSEGVYNSNTVAAVGIACHEAGHAAQHAESYMPIKLRNMILPVCRIGSYAGLPLAMLGAFLSIEPLVWVGILLYSAIMVFQLVTLPVEINASRRAVKCIEEMGLVSSKEELEGVKKVLTAAALTYVASLAVSIGNLLRLIVLFTGKKRR